MKKDNIKELDNRIIILAFIFITLVLLIIGNFLVNIIKINYYELKKEEALKLARSYSYNLRKASQSTELINQLLEEKLLMASKMTLFYRGEYSNNYLAELADTLNIDEIYYYNKQGEIIYSSNNQYIGWKAVEGHPVYDFLHSDKKHLIEDIRQDTKSGDYYKYGYFKAPDGSFVQLGVYADKVGEFPGELQIQQLLEEMKENGDVVQVCFINNELTIIGSTETELVGEVAIDPQTRARIPTDQEYGYLLNVGGEELYEVYVPVLLEGRRIGTLAIRYSLKDKLGIVKQITIAGFLILIIIYSLLLYITISQYRKNKSLVQLAYYDKLTQLPNKQYLTEFLTEELNNNQAAEKALFLININNFSFINILLGYEYGDLILKVLSKKFGDLVDDNKLLFRFTADRFVLYLKKYSGERELITLAQKICQLFYQPIQIKEGKQYLTAQIGIVEIDNKYDSVDRILRNASIVINNLGMEGVCNYAFFNEEMEKKIQREELIEMELRQALEECDTGKLYLEYQPLVDLKTNLITGFEALARMKSDYFGNVSPLEFIDIAEKKRLIVPLGNYILKQACEFLTILNKTGFKNTSVAVNISGIQLLQKDFTSTVLEICKENKIDEANLELEITESVILEKFSIINEKLKELKEHKIGIALDDFGTGYSSLYRLKRLNVDTLKIDRSFISQINETAAEKLLTGDIISIAHKFGIKVVAEGVELIEERDYLRANNCDLMQGYLFSKPLSMNEAITLLKNNLKVNTN
jgi:diguanylate cyclase (GGDEF)-like protein